MKSLKKKKAQQLVEFILVAPILIIFLGIMTEYAYALNINMTLTKGLKTVTAGIYSEIKPSMTASDIQAQVQSDLKTYLSDNNVPVEDENNLKVSYMESGSTAIFMASYTYYSAFTLPNVWFKFLPEQFGFFASNAIPDAFISPNNYDSSITSRKLDNIWSTAASFANEDAFNSSKKGILKSTTGRSNILFLVKTTETNLTTPYALADWYGNLKTDSSGNDLVIDLNNGKFYACSSTACSVYGQTFFNYIINKSFYNLFIVPTDFVSDASILSSVWLESSGSTDISDTTSKGVLKNILSLSEDDYSLGNYDNIDVSAYNADLSTSTKFKMASYGSFILVYPSGISISNIGASVVSNSNYDFNE